MRRVVLTGGAQGKAVCEVQGDSTRRGRKGDMKT